MNTYEAKKLPIEYKYDKDLLNYYQKQMKNMVNIKPC